MQDRGRLAVSRNGFIGDHSVETGDCLADRFYAVAMKSYDEKAGTDPQTT